MEDTNTRTILWVVAAVMAATYLLCAYFTIDRRGDEAALRGLIDEAAAAGQGRDLSGLMRPVSVHYKDSSGASYDQLRMFAAQAIRSDIDYSIQHTIRSLNARGDRAEAQVYVMVTSAGGTAVLYERELTLHFVREPARHALLIPVRVWRIRSVDNLGLDLSGGW